MSCFPPTTDDAEDPPPVPLVLVDTETTETSSGGCGFTPGRKLVQFAPSIEPSPPDEVELFDNLVHWHQTRHDTRWISTGQPHSSFELHLIDLLAFP